MHSTALYSVDKRLFAVDDVNKITSGVGCENLKKFFDDNIEAVQRMRDGEDPPEEEKEVSGFSFLTSVLMGACGPSSLSIVCGS